MVGWLFRLLVGRFTACPHQWETLQMSRWKATYWNGHGNGHGNGPSALMRCKKCGEVKLEQLGKYL